MSLKSGLVDVMSWSSCGATARQFSRREIITPIGAVDVDRLLEHCHADFA